MSQRTGIGSENAGYSATEITLEVFPLPNVSELRRRVTLANFARRLAVLLRSGVNLTECFRLLEENTPEPEFRQALLDILSRLDTGETLSQAMGKHPDWFSATARYLARAGEVGGVMDETLTAWADLIDSDLRLHERLQHYRLIARLSTGREGSSADGCEQVIEQALQDTAPMVRVSLFCLGLGVMVGAGVPVPRALQEAAEVLPDDAAGQVREIVQDMPWQEGFRAYKGLAAIPLFPPLVIEMLKIGEEDIMLDIMGQRAADLLRTEAERQLLCALEEYLEGASA